MNREAETGVLGPHGEDCHSYNSIREDTKQTLLKAVRDVEV